MSTIGNREQRDDDNNEILISMIRGEPRRHGDNGGDRRIVPFVIQDRPRECSTIQSTVESAFVGKARGLSYLFASCFSFFPRERRFVNTVPAKVDVNVFSM